MDRMQGIGQFKLLARTGVWPLWAIVKTRGRVWNRHLPAVCPWIATFRGHVQLAHPGYLFCQDSGSPTARMFVPLVQGGRREPRLGYYSRPKRGCYSSQGSPRRPHPLVGHPVLSLPSLLVSQRDLFRHFFLFLSPFRPLFQRNVLTVWMPLTF